MESKNNGGTAFPTSFNSDFPHEIVGGMTLRDYFAAGFAHQIYHATTITFTHPKDGPLAFGQPYEQTAKQAYEMADAMLAARGAA